MASVWSKGTQWTAAPAASAGSRMPTAPRCARSAGGSDHFIRYISAGCPRATRPEAERRRRAARPHQVPLVCARAAKVAEHPQLCALDCVGRRRRAHRVRVGADGCGGVGCGRGELRRVGEGRSGVVEVDERFEARQFRSAPAVDVAGGERRAGDAPAAARRTRPCARAVRGAGERAREEARQQRPTSSAAPSLRKARSCAAVTAAISDRRPNLTKKGMARNRRVTAIFARRVQPNRNSALSTATAPARPRAPRPGRLSARPCPRTDRSADHAIGAPPPPP